MTIRTTSLVRPFGVLAVVLLVASPAAAQAARTWVSGVGDDFNPCSRALPCRSFFTAVTKTATGGEIDALDTGEFFSFTISKAITIDGGGGQVVGITSSGSAAIVVNAGTSADVVVRNLRLTGNGVGAFGIQVLAARAVTIENCEVAEFSAHGIVVMPTTTTNVVVVNTTLNHNGGSGISVVNNGAFFSRLTAAHVVLNRNGTGLIAADNSLVFVTDSHASNNTVHGFAALPTFGGPAQLDLRNCTSSNNGNTGALSQNPTAVIQLYNTTIDHNGGAGIVSLAGGQLLSFGNNQSIANAGGDGAPTGGAVTVF